MSRRSLAHITFGITLIALSVGLFGCNNRNQVKETSKPSATTVDSSKANKNLPKVLATTNIICDLTKQIAADTIRIKCLIPPKVNPHFYKPKSEDSEAIEQAQLILFNGYDLESKLIELIENSNNSVPKISVAEVAVPNPRKLKLNGKNVADPHVWHDAENGIEMAKVINENLAKLSPENASVYAKNTKKINSELKQIDRWIKSRVASIPNRKRKFVTTHDAMSYYVRAYNFPFKRHLISIDNNQNISQKRIEKFAENIRKDKAQVIFSDTNTDLKLTKSVAKAAKIEVSQRPLFTNTLEKSGGDVDSYQRMMTTNTRTIVEALGGTYLIFEPQTIK
ncbi:zinc ABC transporter substrate-binding protein [Mastigocoleus sp. MO_188.B34]|uniref:metal ABC transporter solute-binding protein, Zn/Mn family n=1 Tax=Mastigocoleus sp. MO_188.B34 TaxID=3036635 RepID=UPI00262B2797|nr:zinc ABC transporter substrate-binding protein [Mastigocoleus sp. MO_188.B34]MDJ0693739.1 zinc ABC transporter substrate-binding protein [Mastigocoleus sp. MO_188.B34]